jgi:hypothetical protein
MIGHASLAFPDAGTEKRIFILRKILSLFTSRPDQGVQGRVT